MDIGNFNLARKPEKIDVRFAKSSRVKEFDPSEHELIRTTSSKNEQYNCPFCLEKRGKEDLEGKLYWSPIKMVGQCFKCETITILKTDKPIYEVNFDMAIRSISTVMEAAYSLVGQEFKSMAAVKFDSMFDPLDEQSLGYLSDRIVLYPDLCKALNLRCLPGVGVAFPVEVDGKILSYTLRYFKPKGRMKYYLPPDTKVLYHPLGLDTTRVYEEVTLVEGPFDAIAALIDGHANPICVFGKSLTPTQIYLLRSLAPSRINAYFDYTKISRKISRSLRGDIPTASAVVPYKSSGYDPEEKLLWKMLNRGEDYIEEIHQNYLEAVNEYNRCHNNQYSDAGVT